MLPSCLTPCKYKIENAAPIFLPCQRQPCSERRSLADKRAARRVRRPACPMPDRGRGLARPSCGVGVVRSFFHRKSHSAPAARLPGLCPGAPLFICEKKNISSYYKVVVIKVPLQGQNATIDKVLWIGLNLLPQDGLRKAPTTALCF